MWAEVDFERFAADAGWLRSGEFVVIGIVQTIGNRYQGQNLVAAPAFRRKAERGLEQKPIAFLMVYSYKRMFPLRPTSTTMVEPRSFLSDKGGCDSESSP